MNYAKRVLVLVMSAMLFMKAYVFALGYVEAVISNVGAFVLPMLIVAVAGVTFLARDHGTGESRTIRYVRAAATAVAVGMLTPYLVIAEVSFVGHFLPKVMLAWLIPAVVEIALIVLMIHPFKVTRRS